MSSFLWLLVSLRTREDIAMPNLRVGRSTAMAEQREIDRDEWVTNTLLTRPMWSAGGQHGNRSASSACGSAATAIDSGEVAGLLERWIIVSRRLW